MIGDIVPMNAISVLDYAALFRDPSGLPALQSGSAFLLPQVNALVDPVTGAFINPYTGELYDPSGNALTAGPNKTTVASSMLASDSTPAAPSTEQALQTGQPVGPQSFLPGLPSVVAPALNTQPAPQPVPQGLNCKLGTWANANPALAVLAAAALFFVVKPRSTKR